MFVDNIELKKAELTKELFLLGLKTRIETATREFDEDFFVVVGEAIKQLNFNIDYRKNDVAMKGVE